MVRINTRTEPTKRSLAYLRAQGWICDIAERQQGPITRDFLGAFDIVGFRSGAAIVVQTTGDSGGNFSARVAKVRASEWLRPLLGCGVVVEVHGWKAEKLEPRVERIGQREPLL